MLQAVKDGHLITWPGLTEDAINKHLKLTPTTAMGHMNQRHQNIRWTSKAPIEKQQPPDTDLGTKTHLVYAVVVDQGQLYTDLTGKFPVRSSKGNYYGMLCYIYDCNYIKVVPMKSRSASEWVKAYDSIHHKLTVKGFKPKLQTLDNEASTALKNFVTVNDIAYQDFQGTLCGRDLLSWPLLPNAVVGQTLATSGNNFKSPADLSSASAALCCRALPWAQGLQQDSFCSARM
jgi:hypothetical protein